MAVRSGIFLDIVGWVRWGFEGCMDMYINIDLRVLVERGIVAHARRIVCVISRFSISRMASQSSPDYRLQVGPR